MSFSFLVQLRATGSKPFVGFLLQARGSGDLSPVGSFTLKTGDAQLLNCSQKTEISSEDCGVTKVCFRHPSNCAPELTTNCYFMSAIMLSASDTVIQYEMTGTSDGYISFGFSDDQTMGNDDIYVCSKTSNDLVQLQHAFSVGRAIPQTLPLVWKISLTSYIQLISCSFTSFNPISTRRSTGVTDPHRSYYLMLESNASHSYLSSFSLWKCAMMLIAWMTTGSIGMMVARYLKGVAKGNHLLGKDVWFLVGTIDTMLKITFKISWCVQGTHPVLGCLVMILLLLHIIMDNTIDQWLMKVMGGLVTWEALFCILLEINFKRKVDASGEYTIQAGVLLVALYITGNVVFLLALLFGVGMS
uniref:DOMON domain-containing protein n=1 Tax=Hippocampus comes TaxID=109280 RepID=A0A3Q3D738_HIPCM